MPKIAIWDQIQAPGEIVRIKYTGKNPFAVAAMMPKLIRNVMKITGKDTFETDIRWDITEDPRPFYGVWRGVRKEDEWTRTQIRVIGQGVQSSKEKTGWLNLLLKGDVWTEFEYNNFIQKTFWWTYNYSFYYKQRRRYLEYAKDNIYRMREIILRTLDIAKPD